MLLSHEIVKVSGGHMTRFSIRDLLWLTVLSGVLLMWWADRRMLADLLIENQLRLSQFETQAKMTLESGPMARD